jgi:hypothetical protein
MWAFDPSVRLGELPSKVVSSVVVSGKVCGWVGVRVGMGMRACGRVGVWA